MPTSFSGCSYLVLQPKCDVFDKPAGKQQKQKKEHNQTHARKQRTHIYTHTHPRTPCHMKWRQLLVHWAASLYHFRHIQHVSHDHQQQRQQQQRQQHCGIWRLIFEKIKSQSRLLKGRRATIPLAEHTAFAVAGQGGAGQQVASLNDVCRLFQILPARHTHTYTRIHKHGAKKRKQKMKTRAWLHFRNVMRKRRPEISAASSCQKKRNRPTRTKKEKTQERTSTCRSVVSHPGWPRVTWYGIPSHFVPLSQSWGVTSGTYIESEQDKKRSNTQKRKEECPRPHRRQATRITCRPGHEKAKQATLFVSRREDEK